MANEDFKSINFETLTWDDKSYQDSLDKIYQNVTSETNNTIGWYLKAKNKKKKAAIIIRFLVIIFGTLGGVVPLLTNVLVNGNGKSIIPPIFAAIFFAMAAFFFGLDKFFGFSAGWMRYMKTQLYIAGLEKNFKFNWEKHQAEFDKTQPFKPFIGTMLDLAANFSSSVYAAIQTETEAWIKNFQGTFEELGKLSESKSGSEA
jgi:SMODS and SLOG-associating 2TM effector domain 2